MIHFIKVKYGNVIRAEALLRTCSVVQEIRIGRNQRELIVRVRPEDIETVQLSGRTIPVSDGIWGTFLHENMHVLANQGTVTEAELEEYLLHKEPVKSLADLQVGDIVGFRAGKYSGDRSWVVAKIDHVRGVLVEMEERGMLWKIWADPTMLEILETGDLEDG